MRILPVTPIEILATAPTRANGNPGIVPASLQHPADRPARAERYPNTGIVPPWMLDRVVGPDHPVASDVPRILGSATPTVFDPTPVQPDVPHILRRTY